TTWGPFRRRSHPPRAAPQRRRHPRPDSTRCSRRQASLWRALPLDERRDAGELARLVLDVLPLAAEQMSVACPDIVARRPLDDFVRELHSEGGGRELGD